ncbi:MAG: cysteine desulfurase family protein [Verrucomicrobiota bacterium]
MRRVFLDHQSGTPVLAEALAAMQPWFAEHFGNPSSLHHHGLRARDALQRAREQFATLLHAESPEEILFTSGGTEAANLAIKGAAWANQRRGKHLVASTVEHPSVLNSVEFLESQGFTCTRVPVDREGRVSVEAVHDALTDETILIAVQHVNHDVGAIQPVKEIGALAAERGIAFYVDASFSGGWLPIDVAAFNASYVSLSPHRFYGPKGVGVLYRNRRARLASVIHGGVQEDGRRAGTENVPGIVGAGVAAEAAHRELAARTDHVTALQRLLLDGLRREIPFLQLNGPEPGPNRIATNLNLSLEFVEGEGVMLRGDLKGITLNSGTACVTKALKSSPVLTAMGVNPSLALGSIILSLGKDHTPDEIDHAVTVLAQVVHDLRALSSSWEDFQARRR